VEDTVLCAACAPPGGGRQEVTSRCVGAAGSLCAMCLGSLARVHRCMSYL
jgi:hypothetical protein